MFHLTQPRVELVVRHPAHSSLDSSVSQGVAIHDEGCEVVWIDKDNLRLLSANQLRDDSDSVI